MKSLSLLILSTLLVACSTADLNRVLDTVGSSGLSSAQISQGLKQALEIGIEQGAQKLAQRNGYYESPYKILLPEEAKKVTDQLAIIPVWVAVEDEITKRLNAAAEDAAKSAAPIFKDAITQMTFQDATNILMGNNRAATDYLHGATYDRLYSSFRPIVLESLNKFNATTYWADAMNTYNKIPFVEKVNPELDDYVVHKALDGLFNMVAQKELGIRTDLSQRTTDLLQKVFAKQDR